jgi:hypothetical protein
VSREGAAHCARGGRAPNKINAPFCFNRVSTARSSRKTF